MRLQTSQLVLAALSIALVTFLVVVDLEQTSPGPLSASHAAVEELAEGACDRCHGANERSLAEACQDCHEVLAAQLTAEVGFHSGLPEVNDCGLCHLEHLGHEVPLVGQLAFSKSGYESRESYSHAGLGFLLTGRHDALECNACHENADVRDLLPGQVRFLGASQECAKCHEDPHQGSMVNSCESCHGQSAPFADLDGFNHAQEFPLTGVHASISCVTCHDSEGAHAVQKLGRQDSPISRECAACHESPHSTGFLSQVSARLETSSAASCSACHALDGTRGDANLFEAFDNGAMLQLHGASGFDLRAPHDQVACAECHDGGYGGPPRVASDCASCHLSPHGKQFDTGPFEDFDCLACHSRRSFLPSLFDADQHIQTGFALSAAHATPNCADCHQQGEEPPLEHLQFMGLDGTCAQCHLDAHEGRLLTETARSGCDACHNTTRFDDLAHEDFDHQRWTGFALEGAHATGTCETCHGRSSDADAMGRRFGKASQLFGEPVHECATCHANVHVGQMQELSQDCESCHNTTLFKSVAPERFDHARVTRFALLGAHAEVACEACHVPRPGPDKNGRVFGLAPQLHAGSVRCASCHEDPHGGRFDSLHGPTLVEGRGGCARCHDEGSFTEGARTRFDHGLWTGFPLEGTHASASCEACHTSPTEASRLGRAKSNRCDGCHTDVHKGQFGAGESARCDRCHTTSLSFSKLAFDHQKDSRFKLDKQHKALKCDACHLPWTLAAGGKVVRYKPLGVECVDCHLGGDQR